MSTPQQIEAHVYRRAGIDLIRNGVRYLLRAEELEPRKSRERINESIAELRKIFPEIDALVSQNAAALSQFNELLDANEPLPEIT